MLYNITNEDCNNISTRDFMKFLKDKYYNNNNFSDIIYKNVIVKDSANNYYRIVVLNKAENDYALIDTTRGIAFIVDCTYITSYKMLLDKLLEDGYKITYED